MYNLRFAKAEQTRKVITNQQLQQIKSMYQEIADQYSRRIESLSDKTNISSILRIQYLREYQKQLADELGKVNRRIESNIKSGMTKTAEAVLEEEIRRAKELGFAGITGKYSNIPTDVVETIISGQLYQGDWSLSSAIWGTNKKIQQDCQNIVARGIAQNKGVYEVAKDLEAYVNPSARKTYRWARDYPGSTKVIDYNASRLARTMMSHAYQEAFERSTAKDPWVEAYQWNTGHNNRVCQLCIEREENDSYGLGPGVYPKGEVPLDHPNGQCFLTIVQTKNTNDVVNDLANWYNGVGDQNMNEKINDFAYSLGYTPEMLKKTVVNNTKLDYSNVVNGKDILQTWVRRPNKFDFAIEDAINAQGFDGLPKVVNAKEFNAYVKNSNFIAQRTYSATTQEILDEYRKQLYEGKWYVDCSKGGTVLGQGMYTASVNDITVDKWLKDTMVSYGANDKFAYTETMTLAKDAKTIDYIKLRMEHGEYVNNLYMALDEKKNKDIDYIESKFKSKELTKEKATSLKKTIESDFDSAIDKLMNFDANTYAVLKGYDAIYQSKGGKKAYTVILNRTKVIIKDGRS